MAQEDMRDSVCDSYQAWFDKKLEEKDAEVLGELRRLWKLGRQGPVRLLCFCAPRRCHADTIARFLNKYT